MADLDVGDYVQHRHNDIRGEVVKIVDGWAMVYIPSHAKGTSRIHLYDEFIEDRVENLIRIVKGKNG